MVNINVFDMVCDAVEEYNNYVSRRSASVAVQSHDERRGIFYNCLRRKFGTIYKHRKDSSSVRASDLLCTFDSVGRLMSFKVPKILASGYCDWNEDLDRLMTLKELQKIANNHSQFYQSRELNDMARIINSIKTT